MKHSYPYGTVLKIQREDSPTDIRRHLEGIRNLGLNFVVIWPAVYWWEDDNGPDYPFATGRTILETAEQLGLKIVMELAGQLASLEYAPDFRIEPDYLVADQNGHPVEFDWSYYAINYNHPSVREMIRDSFTETARHYKNYRALYGYDIWNETMFTSYDSYTLERFRAWLREKYQTVDALNASWERAYREWSQVRFTNWHWASVMPYVDLQEFRKDNVGMILSEWRSIIKAVDPDRPVLADNVGSMVANGQWGYERPQDDWNLAANVDEAGYSVYPKSASTHPPFKRSQGFAGMASSTPDGRFWVAELQTHFATMHIPESRVEADELALWTWEAIGHGARGVIHWKWRPFPKGYQTQGRGIVDLRGEYTERAEAVRSIARVLDENSDLFADATPRRSKVGILFDRMSHELSKAYVERVPLEKIERYTDSHAGLYHALWDVGISARYLTPADILRDATTTCRVLFVSNQIRLNERLAKKLIDFAETGGTLVFDGKLGTVNDTGLTHSDLPGPEILRNAIGYRIADIDGEEAEFSMAFGPERVKKPASEFRANALRVTAERQRVEITDPSTAVVGNFADGRPAVLRAAIGAGAAYVFCGCLWLAELEKPTEGARAFLRFLDRTTQLSTARADHPSVRLLELVAGEDKACLVATNYGNSSAECVIRLSLETRSQSVGTSYAVCELLGGGKVVAETWGSSLQLRDVIPPVASKVYRIESQQTGDSSG